MVGLYSLYVCGSLVILLCLVVGFDLFVVLSGLTIVLIWWLVYGRFVIACFGLCGVVFIW